MCLNKLKSKCAGTGIYANNLQKYGSYSYCAGCITKYKVHKQIKLVFDSQLDKMNYNTCSECKSCKKPPKNPKYSYDQYVDIEDLRNIAIIKQKISVYCSKCSAFKKNEKKFIKTPRLSDTLIEEYKVFDTPMKISDKESSLSNEYIDILGMEENTVHNDNPKLFDIGNSAADDIPELEEEPMAPATIKEEPSEEEIKKRVDKLHIAINKLSLSFLLCKVCSDDEIYERIIKTTSGL